ncbi:MAG: DegT/DnrJ/EryC1/StrS family aminotransferase [Proteobacteria bacterium]|nr:DegT/DnrJ/EryC1/StrS family aminotransferase [Pseudomonadota bacterium]MBU1741302.1 DegT/DnrJ/EryC1/StrS family aminotransferase [Pseudomonadota bacterium]
MSASDKPALLGGPPVNDRPLPSYNTIGQEEKRAVMEVLDTGVLSGFVAAPIPEFHGGPKVRELEAAFCRKFGAKHAVAVNSATSGLYGMLMAMDVGPGDEVVVPPYTMHATASMVLQTGAVPVFADIEDETFGLDPVSVEANLTPYTKGILAVNLFGHPARLEALKDLADQRGLFLLEDNAQAPGALVEGRYTGTVGRAGVFSLNRHKTIQCGEGGVVITDDERVAAKMELVRNHGEAVVADLGITDIANTMGQNLRLGEMEAAVGICQLEKLDGLNAARVRLADRLTEGLADVPGLSPPLTRPNCSHVYYFYVMRYDASITGLSRDLFARAVTAEGYYLRSGYLRPLHLEPLFRQKICFGPGGFPFTANHRNQDLVYGPGLCPTCERLQDEEIVLTNLIYPPLTEADMDGFVAAVKKVLAAASDLRSMNGAAT